MIWDGRVRGFGRGGRVWRRPKNVNLGRNWVETEDEGRSSCEKLRGGLGRPFGSSGVSKHNFRNYKQCRNAEIGCSDLRVDSDSLFR